MRLGTKQAETSLELSPSWLLSVIPGRYQHVPSQVKLQQWQIQLIRLQDHHRHNAEVVTNIWCQTGPVSHPGQLLLLRIPVLRGRADPATGHEEVSSMVTGRLMIVWSLRMTLTWSWHDIGSTHGEVGLREDQTFGRMGLLLCSKLHGAVVQLAGYEICGYNIQVSSFII